MAVKHPTTETITAEFAREVIEQEIARCDRRIAAYSEEIGEDPREAISAATEIARYGHSKFIWELAMQVALGNRTLQSLEASLSYRLLSLCGNGTGTVDRMLAEKIELACIEDATGNNGAIDLLKKIEGQQDDARSAALTVTKTIADQIEQLISDPKRLATFTAYAWPGLDLPDGEDRSLDASTALAAFRDVLNGRVNV